MTSSGLELDYNISLLCTTKPPSIQGCLDSIRRSRLDRMSTSCEGGIVAYVDPCNGAACGFADPACARASGACGHRRDAALAGANDQRIRLLPALGLSVVGRR